MRSCAVRIIGKKKCFCRFRVPSQVGTTTLKVGGTFGMNCPNKKKSKHWVDGKKVFLCSPLSLKYWKQLSKKAKQPLFRERVAPTLQRKQPREVGPSEESMSAASVPKSLDSAKLPKVLDGTKQLQLYLHHPLEWSEAGPESDVAWENQDGSMRYVT